MVQRSAACFTLSRRHNTSGGNAGSTGVANSIYNIFGKSVASLCCTRSAMAQHVWNARTWQRHPNRGRWGHNLSAKYKRNGSSAVPTTGQSHSFFPRLERTAPPEVAQTPVLAPSPCFKPHSFLSSSSFSFFFSSFFLSLSYLLVTVTWSIYWSMFISGRRRIFFFCIVCVSVSVCVSRQQL